MPFKKTREGWVYDPKGKYRLPPGPPAWSNPKPPPKPAPKPAGKPNGG
jgi:hypothetical protein